MEKRMKRIYRSVLELVGNTPLVALERYAAEQGLEGTLLAKVERGNPGGSAEFFHVSPDV